MGIYWIINGFIYGVWVRKGPGGGFFPVIAGLMAILFCVLSLVSERKDKSQSNFTWKAFLPAVALIGLIMLSYVVGMILSMAIYVCVWLKYIEHHTTKSSLSIGIGCAAAIYVMFVLWLRVPMPIGLFESML
ncbi:MAG: hypothetical protein ACI8WT_002472 [Clostridium sp.]|jgi:hypothetical protein